MAAAPQWNGPVLDDHFHMDRAGRGLDAAAEFARAGGTDLVLVHKPTLRPPDRGLVAHEAAYAETLRLARAARDEVGLGVRVVLGPHPAHAVHLADEIGFDAASEDHLTAVDAALRLVEEGQAHGLGEVGRPHWPVSDEVWAWSNELLQEVLGRAADVGCPVQLHIEGEGEPGYRGVAEIARQAGFPLDRLIRHHAPPEIDDASCHGLVPSVIVGKGSVEIIEATWSQASHGCLLETDHLDDPDRPGAVLGPKTVPRRSNELLRRGILGEEALHRMHADLPDRLYGPTGRD